MNIQKFIDEALKEGISEVQTFFSKSEKLSFQLYHHEIDGYKVANSSSIAVTGIYNGKFGFASTEKIDNSAIPYLINGIKSSASVNERKDALSFYKGSEKYKKKNVFNKELETISAKKKIEIAKEIENKLYAYSKDIVDVPSVAFSETSSTTELCNSFGLKLKKKSNLFVIYVYAVAKRGEEVKTGGNLCFGNDLSEINIDEFVKKVATEALSKFGATSCPSKKYPTILKNDVFADLLDYFISQLSAEEIEKHSSLVEGKIGEKIASSKLTVEERPLAKNIFYDYFDDEGVAKSNKSLIKKGVLLTALYNRETAKRAGKETTGNASLSGGKMGISYSNIFVKGTKKSFDEMILPIKEGVYITSLAGLGTGMNASSGNFSCQAEGFKIENGKIGKPLNLITISGNLLSLLKNIKDLDNKNELLASAMTVPDVYIKEMNIGGE